MEKIYIDAKLHKKGNLLSGWTTIHLPATKQEIVEIAKSFGYSDLENTHFQYETNLPKEFTNFIDYGCFITEDEDYTIINSGRIYTCYEKLKFYNTLAICLNDLYNSEYDEDSITRFIYAFAEHSAIILSSERTVEVYYPDDEDDEEDSEEDSEEYIEDDSIKRIEVVEKLNTICVAFLAEGTANFLEGYYRFLDYSETDGDFYVLGAWDIDEYEGETIDDYDDDPVAYLEALTECYELYINEKERYILDIYYASKEVEKNYNKQLEDKLIKLGY